MLQLPPLSLWRIDLNSCGVTALVKMSASCRFVGTCTIVMKLSLTYFLKWCTLVLMCIVRCIVVSESTILIVEVLSSVMADWMEVPISESPI